MYKIFKIQEVKTWSVGEFMEIQRANESLVNETAITTDINALDRAIGHLKRNRKKYMLLIAIIALTVDITAVSAYALGDTAVSTAAIDKAGMTILNLVRRIGYWACLIMGLKDIGKNITRGHLDAIGTCIAMYGLAFGALYFLPWIFDIIESVFIGL